MVRTPLSRSAVPPLIGVLGAWGRAVRDRVVPPDPARDDDPRVLLDDVFLHQIEKLRLSAPRAATSGRSGEHPSQRKAHSIEFADHRAYVPGDDMRLIDWNVYARLGELCLKLTEARESIDLHLLVDCSPSMDWGRPNKLIYARRVAAALGALALSGGDAVHLGLFARDLYAVSPPLRGRAALSVLLERLSTPVPVAIADATERTNLEGAMTAYCGKGRRHGVAVLITDFLTPESHGDALHILTRAGLYAAAIHLVDAEEEQPRLDGPIELVDSETGAVTALRATPSLLRAYEREHVRWASEIEAACRARRAAYVRVSTRVPPRTLVLDTLRGAGVLA